MSFNSRGMLRRDDRQRYSEPRPRPQPAPQPRSQMPSTGLGRMIEEVGESRDVAELAQRTRDVLAKLRLLVLTGSEGAELRRWHRGGMVALREPGE